MRNDVTSPWIDRANEFIAAPDSRHDGTWHTVDYLISNKHCGIDNRVTIESILDYLRTKGIDIDRENFQQTVLGQLKRTGIVATLVYPGPQGGVFIPCSDDDVRKVARQILQRIHSELENVEVVLQDAGLEGLFRQLVTTLQSMQERIG